jgi:hypothetical protein
LYKEGQGVCAKGEQAINHYTSFSHYFVLSFTSFLSSWLL